jgi:hypothetical protein
MDLEDLISKFITGGANKSSSVLSRRLGVTATRLNQ